MATCYCTVFSCACYDRDDRPRLVIVVADDWAAPSRRPEKLAAEMLKIEAPLDLDSRPPPDWKQREYRRPKRRRK